MGVEKGEREREWKERREIDRERERGGRANTREVWTLWKPSILCLNPAVSWLCYWLTQHTHTAHTSFAPGFERKRERLLLLPVHPDQWWGGTMGPALVTNRVEGGASLEVSTTGGSGVGRLRLFPFSFTGGPCLPQLWCLAHPAFQSPPGELVVHVPWYSPRLFLFNFLFFYIVL